MDSANTILIGSSDDWKKTIASVQPHVQLRRWLIPNIFNNPQLPVPRGYRQPVRFWQAQPRDDRQGLAEPCPGVLIADHYHDEATNKTQEEYHDLFACKLCSAGEIADMHHVLFACSAVQETRTQQEQQFEAKVKARYNERRRTARSVYGVAPTPWSIASTLLFPWITAWVATGNSSVLTKICPVSKLLGILPDALNTQIMDDWLWNESETTDLITFVTIETATLAMEIWKSWRAKHLQLSERTLGSQWRPHRLNFQIREGAHLE